MTAFLEIRSLKKSISTRAPGSGQPQLSSVLLAAGQSEGVGLDPVLDPMPLDRRLGTACEGHIALHLKMLKLTHEVCH